MPLQRCFKNGISGWRWGDEGKCYTGPDGKNKAMKQAKAIESRKHMGIKSVKIAPEDLPKTLSRMRSSIGLSMQDVSNISGLSVAAISLYEAGKRTPREDYLNRLLSVYGFKLDALIIGRVKNEKE